MNIDRKRAEKSTLESILYNAIKHTMREYIDNHYMYAIKFNDFFGAFVIVKNILLSNHYFSDLRNSYFLSYEDVLNMYIDLLVDEVRREVVNIDKAIVDRNQLNAIVDSYLDEQLIGGKIVVKPFVKNSIEIEKEKEKEEELKKELTPEEMFESIVDVAVKIAEDDNLNDYEKDKNLKKIGISLAEMQKLGFGTIDIPITNKIME